MSTMAERLAEALAGQLSIWWRCSHEARPMGPTLDMSCRECEREHAEVGADLAQALLPVVEREIAAARGEALREAAHRLENTDLTGLDDPGVRAAQIVRAALTPDPDRDREAKEGGL